MEFTEIGVSTERAEELKRLRETSQELSQAEAEKAFKEGGDASSPAATGQEAAPLLTIKDGIAFWDDYNHDMLEAFPEHYRPVPKPLIAVNVACAIPLMNRFGIRLANAPTWLLVTGTIGTGLMMAAPGLKLMFMGPPEPKEPTPEDVAKFAAAARAQAAKRLAEQGAKS